MSVDLSQAYLGQGLAGCFPAFGRPLRELGIPDDCIFPLVIRGGKEAIIPYGDTMLQPGDQVIAVTSEASEGQ